MRLRADFLIVQFFASAPTIFFWQALLVRSERLAKFCLIFNSYSCSMYNMGESEYDMLVRLLFSSLSVFLCQALTYFEWGDWLTNLFFIFKNLP